VFIVSIVDINKILYKKSKIDPYIKLLEYFIDLLDAFELGVK
jgi:hypothetical protein